MGRTTLHSVAAAVLAAAALPGCERQGDITAEGPNPSPIVAGLSPERREAVLDAHETARQLFPKLFEDYIRVENPSDKDLIAAHARAKEFAEQGKFFADEGYLPGGIRTWNKVLPSDAERIFEKILGERGIPNGESR